MCFSAQVLPTVAASTANFTSILVSQGGQPRSPTKQQQPQPLQPQNNPPDVILQTLPDVVTSFLEQPATAVVKAAPASGVAVGKSVIEPLTTSFLFNGQLTTSADVAVSLTAATTTKSAVTPIVTSSISKSAATEQTDLSHLADLESITDFLGMSASNNNNNSVSESDPGCRSPVTGTGSDLDLMDTHLDWESSSSGSGGSHFEFSCTQDVSDMLCDIGVNEPVDWGVDDIMIRI